MYTRGIQKVQTKTVPNLNPSTSNEEIVLREKFRHKGNKPRKKGLKRKRNSFKNPLIPL